MSSEGAGTPSRKRGRWTLPIGLLLLLVLAALAVRAQYGLGPSGLGARGGGALVTSTVQWLLLLGAAAVEVAILLAVIFAPWRDLRRLGKSGQRLPGFSRRRLLQLSMIPLALLLVQAFVLVWLLHNRHKVHIKGQAGVGPVVVGQHGGHAVGTVTLGQSLGLAGVVGLLVIAAILWLGWRSTRRQQPLSSMLPTELAGDLDQSLEELSAGGDPRQAVIAAYERMQRTLAGVGLPREVGETPLEYLERVLARFEASRRALVRLTDLFETARFSHHPVGAEMRAEAESALRGLRSELAG